jgi:hypothetical protein
MSNKNLLIGLGVALLAYYFYDKKQKEKLQATPYTDVELDKVATDFVNQEIKRILEINPNSEPIDVEKGKNEILNIVKVAKSNNKDVSRANVDRIIEIIRKFQRNQMGDNSMGIATPEEMSLFYDFRGVNKSAQTLAQTPAQNNQYELSSAPKVANKPCKKWIQPNCIMSPCPPMCAEY